MLFLTCTEYASTMSPELMKLRIMTSSIRTRVLIKLGASELICVELSAKICEMCTVCRKCICICEMLFLTCTEYASTMSPELLKFRIMTISIKTKVLIKFGASEFICVELRSKKI